MEIAPMRNIIVGTAGHIDHGKTTLVGALTGIDTDRLAEEKRRGISIDLGFAHLELPADIRIGFVDVPGHERFVRNMLAGATGIDAVLLVIAADESIKPQTREHFEICRLLGITRGVVALTKCDAVETGLLELAKLEAQEFLAGSFLEKAPLVPVSALSGEGVETLKQELARVAASVPERDATRHLRLPIDRAFSMRGFGTVVTGTLSDGSVGVEQEVEALPGGKRLRVRGIEVHGTSVEQASAGQRTALNVAGAETSQLRRGITLTDPGLFAAATRAECEVELLASARPLKHATPVHFHCGTAETTATVHLLEPPNALAPGRRGLARFSLQKPLFFLPGDRFIIRMFSPVVTIGGGVVLDANPPEKLRRTVAAERLRKLSEADLAGRLGIWVREAPYGLELSELVARTGVRADVLAGIGESAGLSLLGESQPCMVAPEWLKSAAERSAKVLQAFHRAQPLQAGLAKEELRTKEFPGVPAFLLEAALNNSSAIAVERDIVRLASHRRVFQQDEQEALTRIEEAFRRGGLQVPAKSEVLTACGVAPHKARTLLEILIRDGRLARLSDELIFHREALESVRALLAGRQGERFSVGDFKEWTGVSRKYAIPLLEYFDRERVTRRQGDTRVVL